MVPVRRHGLFVTYTSIDSVKHVLGIPPDDILDDHILEISLAAAGEAINRYCFRRFIVPTTTSTVIVEATDTHLIRVPDIASEQGLAIEVETSPGVFSALPGATLLLTPTDAPIEGRPYTSIVVRGATLATGQLVRVTARFGWTAVPAAVRQAALLLTTRLMKRKDSPLGIQAAPDMGQMRVSRVDPDVAQMLDPLRRMDATGLAL